MYAEQSVYAPATADEGARVLVMRTWPRGVSLGREAPIYGDWSGERSHPCPVVLPVEIRPGRLPVLIDRLE